MPARHFHIVCSCRRRTRPARHDHRWRRIPRRRAAVTRTCHRSTGRIASPGTEGTSCASPRPRRLTATDLRRQSAATLVATRMASITPSSTRRDSSRRRPSRSPRASASAPSGPFAASLTTDDRHDRPLPDHRHQHRQRPADGRDPHRQQVRPGRQGCTIPATLAVGAHFDCDYSTTAVAGVDREHRHGRQRGDRAGRRHGHRDRTHDPGPHHRQGRRPQRSSDRSPPRSSRPPARPSSTGSRSPTPGTSP